jgi:ornithine cyclodeaminase/alanine dehydrogenase-like protein (mu-crystallin family)
MVEVLVIADDEVDRLVTLAECIELVEESFVEYARGATLMPHKLHLDIPGTKGFMRVMPAAIPKIGYAGVKLYLDPSYNFVNTPASYLLFDIRSGLPVAFMAANRLSQLRTGAASAVATKYLARRNSSTSGVFGSGNHAKTQLECTSIVRKITIAKVYSPTPEHRASFAKEMSSKLGIEVIPVESPDQCARASDIISIATTSKNPVLSYEDVSEGTHINTIGSSFPGRSELPESLILNSRVVVDCKHQALGGIEGSDLSGLIAKGLMKESDVYAEIGEIITGSKQGRTNDHQITVFKNSGMAIWDVICAAKIYTNALQKNIGKYVKLY